MTKYWGIDLGGSKIEGVVLAEQNSPETLCRLRIDTESEGGYQHVLARIQELVQLMANEIGERPQALGVGAPGIIEPESGRFVNGNLQCLRDTPFHPDLQSMLGVPVRVNNDANCFALAETYLGAARGSRCTFGVIIGTGVGGGTVVNGKVLSGLHGMAGEWGHNQLIFDESAEPCYCGHRGCVESVFCGPALERFYKAQCGESCSMPEIASRFESGDDEAAKKTVDRLVEGFGKAISVILHVLDPDVVVIGGGVSNIDALYERSLDVAKKNIMGDTLRTKIVKNELGDSAGVFGAAMLVASESA